MEAFMFNIPPWPDFITESYRCFNRGEKHVKRICKDFVLIFMLENTLYFHEDGKTVSVNPGEWYLQIPGLEQEGRKGSPAPEYFYIHFSASGQICSADEYVLKNSFEAPEVKKLILPIRGVFEPQYYRTLFDRLDNLSKRCPHDIVGKQAAFLNILNHLTNTASTPKDPMQELVFRIMEYLDKNYATAVTCKELSDQFHFTADYLARKMKEYTGMTPWRYLQKVRVDNAKELLSNTDYTLSHIANSIGYSELSLFYKAFRKITGSAPGIWRKKNRGYG